MARIPLQVAGRGLATGSAVQMSGASPIGQALQGLGANIGDVAETYRRRQEQDEDFAATQAVQRQEIDYQRDLMELQTKLPEDGAGLHDDGINAFDKRSKEVLKTLPRRLQGKYSEVFETQKMAESNRLANLQRDRRNTWFRTGIVKATDKAIEQAVNYPESFDAAVSTAMVSIDASGLDVAEKAALKEEARVTVGAAVAGRQLEVDPQGLSQSLGVAVARSAPVASPGDPSLPAGMRNNNPGNIKFTSNSRFGGVVGPSENTDQGDPQAVFESPEAGMRAAYELAVRKYQRGKTTANQLIAGDGGWTPGNIKAAANIARSMGIGPDDDLNLADPNGASRFLRALVKQEHGGASDAYSDAMIASAVTGTPMDGERRSVAANAPKQNHLDVAASFLGASETRDAGALAAFIKKSAGVEIDPRQTAWCAYWLNGVFQSQGIQGTGSGMARSFLDFGAPTDQPEKGDVVVLSRGDPNGPSEHVGIFAGYDGNGRVLVLGGNQGNAVSIAPYDARTVLEFRRPPDVGSTAAADERLARLPGGGPSGGMVVGPVDPKYAALPFAERLKLANDANAEVDRRMKAAKADYSVQLTAYKESRTLDALQGRLSEEDVFADSNLDDGAKAELVRTVRTEQKRRREETSAADAWTSGSLTNSNPRDADDVAKVGKAYDAIVKEMGESNPEAVQSFQREIVRQTGVIPAPVRADIERGILDSKAAPEMAAAFDNAGMIERAAPAAFSMLPSDVRADVAEFKMLTEGRGLSSEAAARQMLERRSPEAKATEERFAKDADKFVSALEPKDVSSELSSYGGFVTPGTGASVADESVLLTEYRAVAREEFIKSGGKADIAKTRALARLKDTWGVSSVSGSAQVMKYPPELSYPPIDGSHDYIRTDVMAAAKELVGADMAGGTVENVFLRPYPGTARDFGAKRPASYMMAYEVKMPGEDVLVLHFSPVPWAIPENELKTLTAADKNARRAVEAGEFQRQDQAVTDQRRVFNSANTAEDTAYDATVGPDWMKARAGDIARERSLMTAPQGKPTLAQELKQKQQQRLNEFRNSRTDINLGGGM